MIDEFRWWHYSDLPAGLPLRRCLGNSGRRARITNALFRGDSKRESRIRAKLFAMHIMRSSRAAIGSDHHRTIYIHLSFSTSSNRNASGGMLSPSRARVGREACCHQLSVERHQKTSAPVLRDCRSDARYLPCLHLRRHRAQVQLGVGCDLTHELRGNPSVPYQIAVMQS